MRSGLAMRWTLGRCIAPADTGLSVGSTERISVVRIIALMGKCYFRLRACGHRPRPLLLPSKTTLGPPPSASLWHSVGA
jgi:hypothetical protein